MAEHVERYGVEAAAEALGLDEGEGADDGEFDGLNVGDGVLDGVGVGVITVVVDVDGAGDGLEGFDDFFGDGAAGLL